ncbi:hypothetical protein [Roseateles sp.]|uniref:hypothetical protein n=1 Tax=Roseateles sp. TaxID=1971397 RepID=UPI0039E90330
MNRLQSEQQRLYLMASPDPGRTRAMVLELARPADWEALSQVWRGVQLDLQLPAPGIAVSGTDGMQLWFSLQAPVNVSRAAAFLVMLRSRYLAGIAPSRLQASPSTGTAWQAQPVPAQQAGTENWSAFVAPDLAPVFADAPWLDIQPSADGQADLLARLQPIKQVAFDAAMQDAATGDIAGELPTPSQAADDVDPRSFLQRVLNDEAAPLALRIEAAKALLPRH